MNLNVVVGNSICDVFHLYNGEEVIYTKERYLPKLLVDLKYFPSISEVRRNRPDLIRTLDKPAFECIKVGKKFLWLTVGIDKPVKDILLLVGPSGSGKTTLGKYLKSLGVPEVVSHTTRNMRENEVDGIDYHFVSKEEFEATETIEHSEYSGNWYGISRKEIEDKLATYDKIFAIVEPIGAENISKMYPIEAKIVFVTIPLKEMEKRMRERKDPEIKIEERLSNAINNKEHENWHMADLIIENWSEEKSKKQLKSFLKL